ncbi:unnamed protein product [Prorocentrum cordatum]|uniref:Uncharacterized protein n=1 Tax=Prorocentrum cordatum TaxID=2364126 RepID=A0ABN9SS78_9DINO|nr:unnamed protein product [Polarella glacialis]
MDLARGRHIHASGEVPPKKHAAGRCRLARRRKSRVGAGPVAAPRPLIARAKRRRRRMRREGGGSAATTATGGIARRARGSKRASGRPCSTLRDIGSAASRPPPLGSPAHVATVTLAAACERSSFLLGGSGEGGRTPAGRAGTTRTRSGLGQEEDGRRGENAGGSLWRCASRAQQVHADYCKVPALPAWALASDAAPRDLNPE